MTPAEILAAVRAGGHDPIVWAPIRAEHDGHVAEFTVMADALRIGGVRVAVSAATEQRIADALDASLLTERLADLIWQQADVRIEPQLTRDYAGMVDWARGVVEHSKRCDVALAGRGGLVANVGKHWILHPLLASTPDRGVNYGWMKPDGSVWQSPGNAHVATYYDRSQTCVLVANVCNVDGDVMLLGDLLRNPTLAPLASATGPLKMTRQPGVPRA